MSLEEQIAQITNPQEFVRLCNAVFTERYDNDFQVIDGTRSDEGNDGYIVSEKRLIAMYCPIKPERKKDSDYTEKIRSDLKKAVALRDSGKYEIKNWTFMTPRKLSSNVIIAMRGEAQALGINATHQEATYLSNEIHRHRHIIRGFPELHLSDVDAKLDEILGFLKQEETKPESTLKARESDVSKDHFYKGDTKAPKDLERVVTLRTTVEKDEAKPQLRSIYYSSGDPVVKINAILGLLDSYNPLEDSAEDLVQLCDEGITISDQIGAGSAKAHFLGQKGYLLSFIYSRLDMQTACQIRLDSFIGPIITENERQRIIGKLNELEGAYTRAFNLAIDIVKQQYDFQSLASILLFIGNAAGQRALYLQMMDMNEQAARDRQICKKALLTAKDVYVYLNDELGKTRALVNLANHIRFFGETKEALGLTEAAIEIAKKYGDRHLLRNAESLKQTLVTGKIPNYLGGERR